VLNVHFEEFWFPNRATHRKTKTSYSAYHGPTSSSNLVEFDPQLWKPFQTKLLLPQTSRENLLNLRARAVAPGKKYIRGRDVKMCENLLKLINCSAAESSISLKFSTEYDHVTPDLHQTFKVNGSKSRSQRDMITAKICWSINNSVADCSILIRFVKTLITWHPNVHDQMSKVKITSWKRKIGGCPVQWRYQNFDWKLTFSSLWACAVHIFGPKPPRLTGAPSGGLQVAIHSQLLYAF